MKVPDAVGVPLIVIAFEPQVAITPAGKPIAMPIPVAPVVLWLILGNTVPMHKVGEDEATPAVLTAETIIVPVAFTPPQPPINVML